MELRSKHDLRFGEIDFEVWSPGRINLIGEHTDYNAGLVLPAAIDRGFTMYVSLARTEQRFGLYSENLQSYQQFDKSSVSLSKDNWARFVQALVKVVEETEKIEVPYFNVSLYSTIPLGGGLSSSAALSAGLLTAIQAMCNTTWTGKRKAELAQMTEHQIGANVGIMDPYAVIHGKPDSFIFLDCQSNSHQLIQTNMKDFVLLLVDSRVTHNLAESGYNDRRRTCEKIVELARKNLRVDTLRDLSIQDINRLKHMFPSQSMVEAEYVLEENERVREAVHALQSQNFNKLGQLMYASHRGLQWKYQVSCKELDFLVDFAENSQLVQGARMMGGGFGGSTINLIESHHVTIFQEQIAEAYRQKFGNEVKFIEARPARGAYLIS